MTTIKAIGALSVAKITGVIGALVGLIFGIPLALVVYVAGLGAGAWAASAVLPLLYGAVGFVGGALYAWLYNIVSRWIGGIEVELDVELVTE